MDNFDKVLADVSKLSVKFVDLRFTDLIGKEQHVTIPVKNVDKQFLTKGKMFDGSSIAGWKGIANSDMALLPDIDAKSIIDPFCEETTLNLRCNVVEPLTLKPYERDPRSVAKLAAEYLKSTGIADEAYFGPEPEFFIFDEVYWETNMHSCMHRVSSSEGPWESGRYSNKYSHGQLNNIGHRPRIKGGYFPVPPVDSGQNIRSEICLLLDQIGIKAEAQHHEVATGQHEISMQFNSMVKKADELQIFKYLVHNAAHRRGKTATFMPKPLVGDNGSGMHCHVSLALNGTNIFSGNKYSGLSELALFYIGGILKNARALNAFTNSTTNSYKRLIPGFEAPVMLAYSASNRSAAIRIPIIDEPESKRIEIRFPDAATNPYLTFSAILMAGLDGICNKIYPGDAMDKNLYDLPSQEAKEIVTVAHSLDAALKALDDNRGFLLQGNVFTNDLIDSYIKLKQIEVTKIAQATHPVEFEEYYSL